VGIESLPGDERGPHRGSDAVETSYNSRVSDVERTTYTVSVKLEFVGVSDARRDRQLPHT
jgi:hypothetical protein